MDDPTASTACASAKYVLTWDQWQDVIDTLAGIVSRRAYRQMPNPELDALMAMFGAPGSGGVYGAGRPSPYTLVVDRIARAYDYEQADGNTYVTRQVDQWIAEEMREIWREPDFVLDLGCGDGRALRIQPRMRHDRYVGMDISMKSLERLAAANPQAIGYGDDVSVLRNVPADRMFTDGNPRAGHIVAMCLFSANHFERGVDILGELVRQGLRLFAVFSLNGPNAWPFRHDAGFFHDLYQTDIIDALSVAAVIAGRRLTVRHFMPSGTAYGTIDHPFVFMCARVQ